MKEGGGGCGGEWELGVLDVRGGEDEGVLQGEQNDLGGGVSSMYGGGCCLCQFAVKEENAAILFLWYE